MAWTAERVESLKTLWSEGLSASQIATRIGGCTRNAVIGKVHRLGLPGRATTSRMKSIWPRKARAPSRPRVPRKDRAPTLPRVPRKDRGFESATLPDVDVLATINGVAPDDAAINRRPFAELHKGDCHWPIGDPRKVDFGFCGATALQGRPYCERHASRAYEPAY